MSDYYGSDMRFFYCLILISIIAAPPVAAQVFVAAQESANNHPPQPSSHNQLNRLYDRLASATAPDEAEGILRQIQRRQSISESATANLLMDRVIQLVQRQDIPLASELMERILILAPQWAEGWYQRAILFQLNNDIDRAAAALIKALSLEPRHIQALITLADLYSEGEDEQNALFVYQQALALYPSSPELQEIVRRLSLKVGGKDL